LRKQLGVIQALACDAIG